MEDPEGERRRAAVGPNKLAEAQKEPGWRAFLRQYRDLMQFSQALICTHDLQGRILTLNPTAALEGGDDAVLPFAVEALDLRGRAVRLGPSVLRTSTAAAVALGALGVLTPRWR